MATELEEITVTAKPLPADGHVDTRDFRLHSAALIGANGDAHEIGGLVAEIQIRQDMYLGVMSGEMMVTDGRDLLAMVNAHGGEYIFLHIEVPEQKIFIKKAFRIYKIANRKPSDSTQTYTVNFVSDELFSSHTMKISKAYVNSTVSAIARDIMVNYLKIPQKRIFIDQTTQPTSVIIPNWRPIEALNWLASRAYTDTTNCFFFYENFSGFHFRSIHSIYKSPTVIKVPFSLENKRGMKQLDMDKFSIDEYEAVRDFDALSTISSGGYAMRLLGVNAIKRTTTKNDYNIEKISKLYNNPPMSNAGNLFSKPKSHFLTYLEVGGMENWIKRVMTLAALNNGIVELTVPGNMGLNAGTMINLRIPYTIPPAEGDMWNKQKSGRHVILATNHKFELVNHKYTSLVLVSRDSLPESLPANDKTLPDKILKMNS